MYAVLRHTPYFGFDGIKSFIWRNDMNAKYVVKNLPTEDNYGYLNLKFIDIAQMKTYISFMNLNQMKTYISTMNLIVFGNFQVHHRSHTGERPFGCTLCDYRTVSSTNLRKHTIVVHKIPYVRAKSSATTNE